MTCFTLVTLHTLNINLSACKWLETIQKHNNKNGFKLIIIDNIFKTNYNYLISPISTNLPCRKAVSGPGGLDSPPPEMFSISYF